MDAGDAVLGLYQVVDPKWSFVVSCDWQCRPQDEQTTVMAAAVQPPAQAAPPPQSKTLDEKDAQIGLYQIVDPNWYFTVTCDWQCRPEGEELPLPQQELPLQELPPQQELAQQEDVAKAPQPPGRTRCNVPLSDSDARIGLYQMVDYRWEHVVSCDWQCKPSRARKSTFRQSSARQSARPSAARESAARESSGRESALGDSTVRPSAARESALPAGRESAARESGARESAVRESSARESSIRDSTLRESAVRPSGARQTAVSSVRESHGPSKLVVGDADSVPLSEADASLGLYQLVNPRWNYIVSCDWQCRPPGEKVYDEEMSVEESGGVPLSESEAQVGLYQLVSARWGWVVSCDWQCRQLGERAHDPDVYSQGVYSDRWEVGGSEVDEGGRFRSTSTLSTCREDDVGRVSLFTQTGEIVMTLVGDEGEAGLVTLDEEGKRDTRVSPDVALDEQEAKERKRELAQLVRELGQDVCTTNTLYFVLYTALYTCY